MHPDIREIINFYGTSLIIFNFRDVSRRKFFGRRIFLLVNFERNIVHFDLFSTTVRVFETVKE